MMANMAELNYLKQMNIKTSSETLYHAAVHSFVHSANFSEDLQNLYKMTFFILQAKYFIETNTYVKTKKELLECLRGIDQEILNICINRKQLNQLKKTNLKLYIKNLLIGFQKTFNCNCNICQWHIN